MRSAYIIVDSALTACAKKSRFASGIEMLKPYAHLARNKINAASGRGVW